MEVVLVPTQWDPVDQVAAVVVEYSYYDSLHITFHHQLLQVVQQSQVQPVIVYTPGLVQDHFILLHQ